MTCRFCSRPATHVVAWNTFANGGAYGVQDCCERHAQQLAETYRECGFDAGVLAPQPTPH